MGDFITGSESEVWKLYTENKNALISRATKLEILLNHLTQYRDSNMLVKSDLRDSAHKAYTEVCKTLNEASQLYYDGKPSGISDEDFDKAIAILRDLEQAGLVTAGPDSPTQKVNGGSMKDTIRHVVPMLSLVDVFDENSLRGWVDAQKNMLFSVEPKIDGLSIELWYKDGKLWQAVTRGNGQAGEDVTAAALKIKSIPNVISIPGELVVRGEVYMSDVQFEQFKAKEDANAKNARNSAVGLLKRKDEGDGAGKYLDCQVFNIQHMTSWISLDHIECLDFLQEQGFSVVSHRLSCNADDVWTLIKVLQEKRASLGYRIDGAVVKANDLNRRKELGDNGVYPKWAVAYKYPASKRSTIIKDLIFQLGKSGRFTPVAILDPIDLDGSTISRCTLHNKNRMLELDVRIGDEVTLYKAGDIIPAIATATHTENSKPFFFPTHCPVCGSALDEDKCVNDTCDAKIEAKLYLWVDKGGLDVRGVSGSLVSQLIEKKLIKTPADYYKLTPADLYKLPRMGAAKVKNVLVAINNTKKKSFPEVLVAFGIDGLGWKAASKLHTHVKSWDQLLDLTEVECINYTSLAVGRSLYKALQTNYFRNLIRELKDIFKFDGE